MTKPTDQEKHLNTDVALVKPALAAPAMSDDDDARRSSTLVIRNVTVSGRRTSVRLEPEMWAALNEICKRERRSVHEVCSSVADRKHPDTSLTAAIRVFIMSYFRAAATDDGHRAVGHGTNLGQNLGMGGRILPHRMHHAPYVRSSQSFAPHKLAPNKSGPNKSAASASVGFDDKPPVKANSVNEFEQPKPYRLMQNR